MLLKCRVPKTNPCRGAPNDLNTGCNGLAHIGGAGLPRQIWGAWPSAQTLLNGLNYVIMSLFINPLAIAQEINHQGSRPNHGNGISNILPKNVRCRTMYRLKQRGPLTCWIQISRRSYPNGSCAGGAQIRQNISKQICRYNHIKKLGLQHKSCRHNINVMLIPTDLRVFFSYFSQTLIPIRH